MVVDVVGAAACLEGLLEERRAAVPRSEVEGRGSRSSRVSRAAWPWTADLPSAADLPGRHASRHASDGWRTVARSWRPPVLLPVMFRLMARAVRWAGQGPHRIVGRRRPLPRGDDSTGPPARQERVLIDVAMPGWDIPTGHLFGRSPRIRPTRTLAGTEVLRKPQDLTTGADLHLRTRVATRRDAYRRLLERHLLVPVRDARLEAHHPDLGWRASAPLGRRARGTPSSESLARPAACPARTVRSNRAARSRRRAPRTRRSTEPCSGPRAAAHRGAPSWRRPAGGRRVSLPLVAHEQQRGVRVVDEVSQVPHHPAAGQHPVGGHDRYGRVANWIAPDSLGVLTTICAG